MQKLCEAENTDKDFPGPKNLAPVCFIAVRF